MEKCDPPNIGESGVLPHTHISIYIYIYRFPDYRFPLFRERFLHSFPTMQIQHTEAHTIHTQQQQQQKQQQKYTKPMNHQYWTLYFTCGMDELFINKYLNLIHMLKLQTLKKTTTYMQNFLPDSFVVVVVVNFYIYSFISLSHLNIWLVFRARFPTLCSRTYLAMYAYIGIYIFIVV